MFARRLFSAITLLFAVCSAGAQQSISNGTTSAATISPYIQHRSSAYTSFDNPYAEGGVYDYRQKKSADALGSRLSTSSTSSIKTKHSARKDLMPGQTDQSPGSSPPVSLTQQTDASHCFGSGIGGISGSRGKMGPKPLASSKKFGCGSGSGSMSGASLGSTNKLAGQKATGLSSLDQFQAEGTKPLQSMQSLLHQ
jgi:hypothetical protein